MDNCKFCNRENIEIIAENELAIAFFDACPVSEGHALVIPKRHVETYFEATPEEHGAISQLVGAVKDMLDEELNPDGYNIGSNVGPAAGQTIFHFHVHIIPRYRGDVEDPRGGVRKVIPNNHYPRQCCNGSLH